MNKQRLPSYNSSFMSYKEENEKEIKVAFYTRVSTLHLQQRCAMENQLDWCDALRASHHNWVIPDELLGSKGIYIDEGITGTQAKKRVGFLQAIEDGKKGVYDLLVVRDVSRFARNCEESLRYTHELKKYGVEVFFSNDGIWSKDPDGDLRLGIMSILAQDESRRISEKVLAGQSISRQNGKLYGTGNILGYRLIKEENTYEIIEEDAETVRMIFDMYVNQDLGIKKIASKMTVLQRKNASGIVRWDAGKISRILDNRTYAGYIGYKKSSCIDFLEHTRVKNDKSVHEYVKGKFPAIVDDDLWQKAQSKKRKNSIIVHQKIEEGKRREQDRIQGKKPAKDKWVKKLRCSCNGSSYKKFKWRTNAGTGEECFGYQCNNIVLHRKRDFIEKQGLSGEGYCNVPSIAQWKLEFQLRLILERIWENPDKTLQTLMSTIKDNYTDYDVKASETETAKLLREEKRLCSREDRLLETFLDGIISKEKYTQTQTEIAQKKAEIKQKIDELTGREKLIKESSNREEIFAKIRAALEHTAKLDSKFIDAELVDSIVERVVPYEDGLFKWYINLSGNEQDQFYENDFAEYGEFSISFEQCKAYRKEFGNFIRIRQWKEMKVAVFIRVV